MKIGDIAQYEYRSGLRCSDLFMVVDMNVWTDTVTVEDTLDGTIESWDYEGTRVVQAWPG